jgi:hypothetical protein
LFHLIVFHLARCSQQGAGARGAKWLSWVACLEIASLFHLITVPSGWNVPSKVLALAQCQMTELGGLSGNLTG